VRPSHAIKTKLDLLEELRELQRQMAQLHRKTDARLREIASACKPKKTK
jgi:DNA-binding protein H-NS